MSRDPEADLRQARIDLLRHARIVELKWLAAETTAVCRADMMMMCESWDTTERPGGTVQKRQLPPL